MRLLIILMILFSIACPKPAQIPSSNECLLTEVPKRPVVKARGQGDEVVLPKNDAVELGLWIRLMDEWVLDVKACPGVAVMDLVEES